MSDGLSLIHINTDTYATYEAARTGFFTLMVPDLNGIMSVNGKDAISNSAEQAIRLSVTKAKVPHFSLETLEYRRGNDVVKFAGVPTFQEGSIEVEDIVGLDTKSILMAWQGLAYDVNTRKGGRMTAYKRDCTLVEYTQDFEEIRSWKLYGCWVSEVSEDDFDKENDGKRKLTATIQYDRAKMELPNKVKE